MQDLAVKLLAAVVIGVPVSFALGVLIALVAWLITKRRFKLAPIRAS